MLGLSAEHQGIGDTPDHGSEDGGVTAVIRDDDGPVIAVAKSHARDPNHSDKRSVCSLRP